MKDQKTKPEPQRDRFIETAKKLGCDEDEERFNETLKRIAPKPSEKSSVKPPGDHDHHSDDQS